MESRRVRLPDTTHTVVDDDNFAVQAGSRLSLALNESVKVANNTNVVDAEESTADAGRGKRRGQCHL